MHQSSFVAKSSILVPHSISRAHQAVAAADRLGDYKASILARVIAKAYDLDVSELFHHSRSRAPIASTRQLAMYMMHVVLGRSLTKVGIFYGRDRTTVAHACSRIEDMRDDCHFDDEISSLENQLEVALKETTNAQNHQPSGIIT